jgi:spermidine synthase
MGTGTILEKGEPALAGASGTPSSLRAGAELFLISLLILYLELASIRWFPAHVLFLTFFTNTILLSCFLGMSLGCMAASRPMNLLTQTPTRLALTLTLALLVERLGYFFQSVVDVGNQASPQLVFFGTEYRVNDLSHFFIPIEVLNALFFWLIALTLMGPGQELGRALKRLSNPLQAYTLNILGSLCGIVLFATCAWWELSPFWWFLLVVLGLGYFLAIDRSGQRPVLQGEAIAKLVVVLVLASLTSVSSKFQSRRVGERLWSPYYRIDYYYPPEGRIVVNLIGHQALVSRNDNFRPAYAYALPYLLHRDAGGEPFEEVLVIGAGAGNDVSRALQWGARHVDAVEIDPVIVRLGRRDHPDHPYQDARVTLHIDDGRNFLRSTSRRYDLIIYALVDSLVLHSGYSNIRLESYLFTRQALADVRRHLKPGGLFAMYNYFRQGWIVARLHQELRETFKSEPLVLTLPYQPNVEPGKAGGFTMLLAGDAENLRRAFQRQPAYFLRSDQAPSPSSPNGFEQDPGQKDQDNWVRFGPATVVYPGSMRAGSDDWPFLYLRRPMIPKVSLRGAAIMGGLALLLLFPFLRERRDNRKRLNIDGRMFFLGAGFMLVEARAVVHMGLLFGSTWMVNTVVFIAVLLMILAANLFVLRVRPDGLWPYYLGLLATLALNILVPLDLFLGKDRTLQLVGSSLLIFAPILFAGVIFAVSFRRSAEPDRDFGANVAGAILGGLTEYSSMLLGFQNLMVVAVVFYALSALLGRKPSPALLRYRP